MIYGRVHGERQHVTRYRVGSSRWPLNRVMYKKSLRGRTTSNSPTFVQSYTILCYTILCYTILYYTILYYTILYYTILYYTILYYTILYYTILYYTILYYTILYYTILYYTILYYTILYYTILYYTILYYTILYYTILLLLAGVCWKAARLVTGGTQATQQASRPEACRLADGQTHA